jgi:hypothetical protein
MKHSFMNTFSAVTIAIVLSTFMAAQDRDRSSKTAPGQFSEWTEEFDGDKLDEKKWEKFTFEGASGGKLEVKNGELQIRSSNRTRAGVRTKDTFSGERFAVEARLAKVGVAFPEPGSNGSTLGFATLTILFDGSGKNRIEWLVTSEGTMEAWSVIDGRGERLDNRKLGTKMKNPVLLVARKGDEFKFYINGPDSIPQDAQLGLTTTLKNLPKSFHVMLYGYGSSENNWDGVRIVVPN